MKHIKQIALFSAFGLALVGSVGAEAKEHKAKETQALEAVIQVPHAGEKPLMVVRFNEATVAYEWPLYETLSKALEVKPNAQFDVVSAAPRSQKLDQQLTDSQIASQDLAKVLATLKEIGMPEDRYSVSKIYDDVKTSEIRIYVR